MYIFLVQNLNDVESKRLLVVQDKNFPTRLGPGYKVEELGLANPQTQPGALGYIELTTSYRPIGKSV